MEPANVLFMRRFVMGMNTQLHVHPGFVAERPWSRTGFVGGAAQRGSESAPSPLP